MRAESDPVGEWPPELIDLYSERRLDLVRLAYLLTGHSGVAEEIVHDAVVEVLRRWSSVAKPYPYLRAAVVNGCRGWHRHQQVARFHSVPGEDVSFDQPDELWDALAGLDAERRAAVVLRFYADLPHAEIGRILSVRPATVRTMIHRALRQLRREIAR